MEAPSPAQSYRERARGHLSAAQALLANGGDRNLVYACLELRLTIECLAYDILQLYRSDVPHTVLVTWQADKVLREIAELDPGADGPIKITIEGLPGGAPLELIDYRISSAWARKAYQQLGNFLHERMLLQLDAGQDLDGIQVRDRAGRIAEELAKSVNSVATHFRVMHDIRGPCACGGTIIGAMSGTQIRGRGACGACRAPYNAFWLNQNDPSEGVRFERPGEGP